MRESPALRIVSLLREDGYDTRLVDPLTREYPCADLAAAAEGCDLLVVLVPHRSVTRELATRYTAIASVMRRPALVDVSGGTVAPVYGRSLK